MGVTDHTLGECTHQRGAPAQLTARNVEAIGPSSRLCGTRAGSSASRQCVPQEASVHRVAALELRRGRCRHVRLQRPLCQRALFAQKRQCQADSPHITAAGIGSHHQHRQQRSLPCGRQRHSSQELSSQRSRSQQGSRWRSSQRLSSQHTSGQRCRSQQRSSRWRSSQRHSSQRCRSQQRSSRWRSSQRHSSQRCRSQQRSSRWRSSQCHSS